MEQILLIGDSIRMGYGEDVKARLASRAEVIYPKENCRSSQYILMNLYGWVKLCDRERVKVIHFNCGHWDAARFNGDAEPLTSLAEYRKNLFAIVRNLKVFFPNATIIFATTTPMNPRYPDNMNPRTNEDILRYNEVAELVMAECGVLVNDLFAVAREWGGEYYVDYCHLTEEGYRILGARISEYITGL